MSPTPKRILALSPPARTPAEHTRNVQTFLTLALGGDPANYEDDLEPEDDDGQLELRRAS